MKIGFVIPGDLATISGGYYYDRRLITSLRTHGDSVELISLPRRAYLAQLTHSLHTRLPHAPLAAKDVGGGFDILIEDELAHPSLVVANREHRPYPRISLVHHFRSSEPAAAPVRTLFRLVERRYLRQLDGCICNSMTTRKALHDLGSSDMPALVAPPPCDRFGAAISESAILHRARQPGMLRLVFLGNVIRRKGLHTLLDALAHCPAGRWALDVVGSLQADPRYARTMQRRAAGMTGSGAITFHGALQDDALAAVLAAAHVLALPSQYEGYGIAYLEGMSFGLPVLATRSGAATELVEHGVNGLLIDSGAATQLAAWLQLLISDRRFLAQLGVAARGRYLREPPWDQTVASIRMFLLGLRDAL